ncbi:MAG: histidine kinase, partial [Acidobacteriales bacterium]|nr:histidine kinase [Terriglobales bacterium]
MPQKSAEEWLEKTEQPEKKTGRLKIFLGYAPGVGKTFSMLSEARRRKSRGEDVVIGVIETHGRQATAELVEGLEIVPRLKLTYKGTEFEEMDVDRILARNPAVALVDELAHTNIEGSRHRKRYEDVLDLLNAKIDVLSTLNVQHVESATPTVQNITGVPVRETVPDWVLKRADEVVLVDLTPEALEERMRRGDIYGVARAEGALKNFFRRGNLIALREIALRHVTESVDRSLEDYLRSKRIDSNWGVAERVAVCISSSSRSQQLIARGARMSRGLDVEDFYVIHV